MIANARMYSVAPPAKVAWAKVLAWVLERAGVRMEFVDQEPPATLADLWGRSDLGCVMMCGLPYSHREPRPILLAAPVPSPGRYENRPVYFSDVVVRADSPFMKIEDAGSIIQALVDGRIDVGPLDSYVHDLIRQNDPGFAAHVRTIAVTDATPMPPLIATAALDPDTVSRLQSAFLAAEHCPDLAHERETLLLRRFALPESSDYDVFDAIAASSARHAGVW